MTIHPSRELLSAGYSPIPAARERRAPLNLYILATSTRGTRAALQSAGACARGLDAQIVLLVPHVVPYAQTLEHPADSVKVVANRYRSLACELGVDVTVRVCLCRPHSAALTPLVPGDAAVLIGGRTRHWWPTREQRLARRLMESGRHVLFVPARR